MNIFMLCGMAGAGKSWWAEDYIRSHPGILVINKDWLRRMLYNSLDYVPELEPLIKDITFAIMRELIRAERDFIIDGCHLRRAYRCEVLDFLQQALNDVPRNVVIVYFTEQVRNLSMILKRGDRGRSVAHWVGLLRQMELELQPPSMDEHRLISRIIEVKIP